jgi:hypothetical protein
MFRLLGNHSGKLHGGTGREARGMTNLLWALLAERKRLEQAIRKLQSDMPHPGARTRPDIKVIPIRRDILASDEDREVANLAFDIWLSNGFRGGSPEEALMTALRQSRTKAAELFLVPKRKSNSHPFPAMRFHSN